MYFPQTAYEEFIESTLKSKRIPALASVLFGHRLVQDQTIYEYLLEFLQVMISDKNIIENEKKINSKEYFPQEIDVEKITKIEYEPITNMGLRRYIFFNKSKQDTQAKCDDTADKIHRECIQSYIEIDSNSSRTYLNGEYISDVLQELLYSFSGILNNRSWSAQTLLPICPQVVIPEAMPTKKERNKIEDKENSDFYKEIDKAFDFNQYNFMARGGEVYYLHVLRSLYQNPKYIDSITQGFNNLLHNFPEIEKICDFIQNVWDEKRREYIDAEAFRPKKTLAFIPEGFDARNKYTVIELHNFLRTDMHPFEKIEVLSQGIILQILRMQHLQASQHNGTANSVWLLDLTDNTDKEVKKQAISNYIQNEENVIKVINKGYREIEEISVGERDKVLKKAEENTYKLYRKLGKQIGFIIPLTGTGMRFSLSEKLIKFLVIALIEPGKKITLDSFIDKLYAHYGIIIDKSHYDQAVITKMVENITNRTFLENNKKCFIKKLKESGFLRDLSDATSIVENPYLEQIEVD